MHVHRPTLTGSSSGDINNPALPVFADAVEVGHAHAIAVHTHLRGQLVYASHGTVQVHSARGCMLIPPQMAMWIPPCAEHAVEAASPVRYCSLFVDPSAAHILPSYCLPISMNNLVKELALTAANFNYNYKKDSPESRLIGVLMDQLASLRAAELIVPLPSETRLRTVAETMLLNPGEELSIAGLAKHTHMSPRSFERLFKRETGLSFGQWRQRLQVHHAIQCLNAGKSVKSIAIELGYHSSSAFITMFRRVTGYSPKRYLGLMT